MLNSSGTSPASACAADSRESVHCTVIAVASDRLSPAQSASIFSSSSPASRFSKYSGSSWDQRLGRSLIVESPVVAVLPRTRRTTPMSSNAVDAAASVTSSQNTTVQASPPVSPSRSTASSIPAPASVILISTDSGRIAPTPRLRPPFPNFQHSSRPHPPSRKQVLDAEPCCATGSTPRTVTRPIRSFTQARGPHLSLDSRRRSAVDSLIVAARRHVVLDCATAPGSPGRLSAAAIRTVLVERAGDVSQFGLRISNARITGQLDLSGCSVGFPIQFHDCEFVEPLLIEGSDLDMLAVVGRR